MSSPQDDHDIELIKARKLKEMREKAAAFERARVASEARKERKQPTARDIVTGFLYSRGDEVLRLAYEQFPAQTEAIVSKIAQLILAGELTERISGGELLSLFRSVGLRIRVDTTIKVEDDGKFIPLSEKLKQHEG
jgi:DNA-binding TFAR19-related protein (PDSD5 family)